MDLSVCAVACDSVGRGGKTRHSVNSGTEVDISEHL
jgi:hypothetical protein